LLQFTLTAHSLARFVELKIPGKDVVFSDNYFDIPAGYQVIVTCPVPEGITLSQLKKSLRVNSLFHSFST
jgi:beta-mannosidase